MAKDLVIFIDCGDTLADESTQIFDENEVVQSAELIPGAREMLVRLRNEGYRIALVADGLMAAFRNIFRQHGLEYIFEQWITSEEVGVVKPHELMFSTAMAKMGLIDQDKDRVVMIGNNLQRDIAGARSFGIKSILESFSPRYNMKPAPGEEPDYVVRTPLEIPDLLNMLDQQYKNKIALQDLR